MTYPSDQLPHNFADAETSHSKEDAALWNFIAFILGFCGGDNEKERFLRNEAKAFLDWNEKHLDRTRWYARAVHSPPRNSPEPSDALTDKEAKDTE